MEALTSEKVLGVFDDATYCATLCLARDGRRYFFSAIEVDGEVVPAPNKRWNSRRGALQALTDIATARQKPAKAASKKSEDATTVAADPVE